MSERAKRDDMVGARIRQSLSLAGVDILALRPIGVDDAWKEVAYAVGWGDFLLNRHELPGGLIERQIKNIGQEVIGWAFVGPKDLDRPDGLKKGVIGLDGAIVTLGNFPNKL